MNHVSVSTYALIHTVCSAFGIIHIYDTYYLSPRKKYLWSSVLYSEFLRFVLFASDRILPVLGPTVLVLADPVLCKIQSVGIQNTKPLTMYFFLGPKY